MERRGPGSVLPKKKLTALSDNWKGIAASDILLIIPELNARDVSVEVGAGADYLRGLQLNRTLGVDVDDSGAIVPVVKGERPCAGLKRLLEEFFPSGTLENPLLLIPLRRRNAEEKLPPLADSPQVREAFISCASDSVLLHPSPHFRHQLEVVFSRKLSEEVLKALEPFFIPYSSMKIVADEDYGVLSGKPDLAALEQVISGNGGRLLVSSAAAKLLKRTVPTAGMLESLQKLSLIKLYGYQLEGAAFLASRRGGLLADDMGLGKSVQSAVAARFLRDAGRITNAIIFCPASLQQQWVREIERFTGLSAVAVGGTKKQRSEQYRERAFFHVINYELALRDTFEIKNLEAELIILDEAQRVKNFRSKSSKTISDLPRKYSFALTGTPLENALGELYTIVRFVDKRALYPNPLDFLDNHVVRDHFKRVIGYVNVPVLRRKLSGVTLRRRKDEVLEQLPPRLDQDLYIEMTKRQKSLYHDVEAGLGKWVEGDEDEQMNPLARLTHLREICDSTALFRDDLFESCKLDELKPLVSELRDTRKKLIIFSAFERMTRMIEEALNKESHETLRVHGGVSSSKRAGIFDSFNSPDGPGILVMTDAGALGVNLQAAEVVVNFDLPFNPAILEQRIARAHRMGQLKSVNVLNLICQNSVEVGIRKLLRKKMELFREVVEGLDGPVAAASGGLRELCEFLLRNKTA